MLTTIPRRTDRNDRWTATGLLLAILASGSGCHRPLPARSDSTPPAAGSAQAAATPRPVSVKVVRPMREFLRRTATQPAHVEPYEKADIYAKASGYLREIRVDIGDRVSKGQVLAEIWVPENDTELKQKQAKIDQAEAERKQAEEGVKVAQATVTSAQAGLAEVQAGVKRADADLARWQAEYRRVEQLFNERAQTGSLLDETRMNLRSAEAGRDEVLAKVRSAQSALSETRAKLDQARADVAVAAARTGQARSELEHLQTLMQYTRIAAPFDGIVTRRLADTGAFIQSAATQRTEPLLVLMRVDRQRIVVDIPESEAGWVWIGLPATFRASSLGGPTFSGKVARFADSLDPSTRTMRTEVELDRSEVQLRAGTYGSITITLAEYPDALVLPAGAVLTSSEDSAVMIAEGGRARRRAIRTGLDDGVRVQVTAGLDGTEAVIIDKGSVRDGEVVILDTVWQ